MDTPTTRKEMGSKNSVLGECCTAKSVANHQISFLLSIGFLEEEGGNVYIRDPDLYRAAWFLALPDPMNRVLLLIYPKHQISPLL